MNNWQIIKLGEVCEKVEKVKRSEKKMDETFLYLDIGGIDNGLNKIVSHKEFKWKDAPSRAQQIIKQHDVLFSTVRTYLKNIAYIDSDVYNTQIASSGFCVIRANQKISLPKYLFYYSISQNFLEPLNKLQTGSSYPAVRDKDVFSQFIPIPSLSTQQAIVSKIEELFSELDQGIAALKKAQEQLKTYRQSVLKWAFEGKLSAIKNEELKIKNKKERELPEGWRIEQLKNISSSIQYGYTESSSKENIGPKFLRITDIQNNSVNWIEVPHCKISKDNIEKYLLKDGDLVFARTGATVGKSFLIKGEIPDAVFASYLIRVRVSEKIDNKYLSYFFNSPNYWNQITEGQVGIGQPNVNGTKLGHLNIVLAPLSEQQLIVQAIESRLSVADKLAESISESLQKAEALRQSILKRAFSNQLKINN